MQVSPSKSDHVSLHWSDAEFEWQDISDISQVNLKLNCPIPTKQHDIYKKVASSLCQNFYWLISGWCVSRGFAMAARLPAALRDLEAAIDTESDFAVLRAVRQRLTERFFRFFGKTEGGRNVFCDCFDYFIMMSLWWYYNIMNWIVYDSS